MVTATAGTLGIVAALGVGWLWFTPAAVPDKLEYLPAGVLTPAGQLAQAQSTPASDGGMRFDFSNETVGVEPKSFLSVVGFWTIGAEGDNKFLVVDGRRWKAGQPAANLADKARAIYGERYAEFLDNVQAYAYFPYAVAQGIDDFRGGEISFRFKPVDGRIDQGAGILFNLKPNGDYLLVRANALENNLVLFKYEKGKRSSVAWIRNTPTSSGQWHDLKVRGLSRWQALSGAHLAGTGGGKDRRMVEGRQRRLFRRLSRHASPARLTSLLSPTGSMSDAAVA
jgi:hypothetical protein